MPNRRANRPTTQASPSSATTFGTRSATVVQYGSLPVRRAIRPNSSSDSAGYTAVVLCQCTPTSRPGSPASPSGVV